MQYNTLEVYIYIYKTVDINIKCNVKGIFNTMTSYMFGILNICKFLF